MEYPLISIIVPIYNMEKLLSRCIDSIINQSNNCIELILINDGSTDSSGKLCDQYANKDQRIKVFHKTNGGVSDARNYGLDNARGEYISFVDPDDWVEPTTYDIITDKIRKKQPDILRFNAYRDNQTLNKLPFDGLFEEERLKNEFTIPMIGSENFGGMFILGVLWIHIFKREIIENNNIRFNPNLHKGEDRLFTLTVFLHAKKAMFISDILYHYDIYINSLSNRYDSKRWQQELLYLNKLEEACKQISISFYEQVKARIKNEYLLRAKTSINHEIFSDNNNTFWKRSKRIRAIVNSQEVRDASSGFKKNKLRKKDSIILWLIVHKKGFTLSLFETAILFWNKLKKKIIT